MMLSLRDLTRCMFLSLLVPISCLAVTSCSEPPATEVDRGRASDDEDDEGEEKPAAPAARKDAGRDQAATSGDDEGAKPDASKPSPDAGTAKGDAAAAPDAGSKSGAAEDGLPCAVAKIVSEKCSLCHQDPPGFGAPYSLLKRADFTAMAVDGERKVHAAALARITASTKKMPPTTSPQLTAEELKTLSEWLSMGAPAGQDSCAVAALSDEKPNTPAGAGGSGGASVTPIDYQDPDLECFKFTAYSQTERTAPYDVPTTPDFYVLFTLKAPWTGTRYIRSFKSITDNKAAIHHWILFADLDNNRESVQQGTTGAHPNSERLFGWAPGGDDLYYDPDVGMKVSGDVSYSLETHYNNTSGGRAKDASGVEVCVTTKPPKYEVTQAWVGTDSISGTSASGTCVPTNKEPVKILAAHPHMHKSGKNMKVEITRAGGMKETVFDKPFDFDYQKVELVDITVNPGDRLTTTCTYSQSARFGTGTNDEMCYFFPISYPANALVSDNLYNILHGPNTCIQ